MTPPDAPHDAYAVTRALAALPHRGSGTPNEAPTLALVERLLHAAGATTERQTFRAPRTYHVPVAWLTAGLATALLGARRRPGAALALGAAAAVAGARFLDWRAGGLTRLPPQRTSANVVARWPEATEPAGRRTVVLMAHHDSAPVSMFYRDRFRAGFQTSVRFSIALMAASVGVIAAEVRARTPRRARTRRIVRQGLAAYFTAQLGLLLADFARYGYTNGANDNASGVGAALDLACRFAAEPIAEWDVEVVLTGAEEHGMIGAHAYFEREHARFESGQAILLNLDTVGRGQVTVAVESGTLTRVRYRGRLLDAARRVAGTDPRFGGTVFMAWRQADVDSVWFARAGTDALTVATTTEDRLMPHIHRPEDDLSNVDPADLRRAVAFAEAVVREATRVG